MHNGTFSTGAGRSFMLIGGTVYEFTDRGCEMPPLVMRLYVRMRFWLQR